MTRSLLLSCLVGSTALAQVYTWTDKDGVTHFTDNPGSVPANVKAKVTEGSEISTVSLPKADERPADKAAVVVKPVVVEPSDPNRAEREWRAAFREANERVARLQDEIEVDRKKVEDVNGLPVAARYQCLYGYGGGWVVPGGVSGSSVSFTGQAGLGGGVQGSVVVQNQVVVPNPGVVTAPCVFTLNPEFERAKERLELNRKALVRAKADLSELERRAGFEGVPREWRR
ncbi:MAG: DUF4124 domain-containing protein [Archangium sp.]|nr:DUF4124 domain-containing protein [Archangium sp.]